MDYGVVIPGSTDGYTGSCPRCRGFRVWCHSLDRWGQLECVAVPQPSQRCHASLYVQANGTHVTTGTLSTGNPTQSGTNGDNLAFLKFDLSTAGITASQLAKATLRLYEADGSNQNGGVLLYKVNSTWTDSTVSYSQSVDTVRHPISCYDPANLELFIDIDVTSIVQGWLADYRPTTASASVAIWRARSILAGTSAACTTVWTGTGRLS